MWFLGIAFLAGSINPLTGGGFARSISSGHDVLALVRETPVEQHGHTRTSTEHAQPEVRPASADGALASAIDVATQPTDKGATPASDKGATGAAQRLAGGSTPSGTAGGPGVPDKNAKEEGSSWDYYMSGTGLVLWLGPLLCISLVACLAIGGKYYREQTKNQARRARDERLVAPPTHQTLRDTHATTTLPEQHQTAFDDRSVPKLVAILDDTAPLAAGTPTDPHPWATPPKTVGALAGMHIASLAGEDPYGCAAEVYAAGGLPKFVAWLDQTEDRQHIALITLALLAYNDVCANALVDEAVTTKLVSYKAVGPYQRTTVAIILRYVFFYSEQSKSSFVQKHGLSVFTDLLKEPDPAIQLTAVTNILDILFGAGGLDAEILACLQGQWATIEPVLAPMAKSSDADVAENAAYLLQTIYDPSYATPETQAGGFCSAYRPAGSM